MAQPRATGLRTVDLVKLLCLRDNVDEGQYYGEEKKSFR